MYDKTLYSLETQFLTMATLLPTLSSDEEDNITSNPLEDIEESDDDVDDAFEFGGILVRSFRFAYGPNNNGLYLTFFQK